MIMMVLIVIPRGLLQDASDDGDDDATYRIPQGSYIIPMMMLIIMIPV